MKRYLTIVITSLALAGCSNDNNGDPEAGSAGITGAMTEIQEVTGIGRVEPEGEILSLAAPEGGIIREIVKTEGSPLSKNDIIMVLDNDIELIKVEQLKYQHKIQAAQLDIDKAALQEATVRLENRKRLLLSVGNLVDIEAESRQALDDLQTEARTHEIALEKAAKTVELSEYRTRELGEQLKLAEAEASKKILRSPADGILLDIHFRQGGAVAQYDVYAEVAPAGRLTVRAEIDELFAGRISEGLAAEVRLIGLETSAAKGTVT